MKKDEEQDNFCLFNIRKDNKVRYFENVVDPYNPENKVTGFINQRPNTKKGALIILAVNGEQCYQEFLGTPKMHYPHDSKQERWKFPPFDTILAYEKVDGTNILSYVYRDKEGNRFLTFKTRQSPFLIGNDYGDFKAMWDDVLKMYPDIRKMCFNEEVGYSFELYGERNRILVKYEVNLDTTILFRINQGTGNIMTPDNDGFNVPCLRPTHEFGSMDENSYLDYKQMLSNNLNVDEESEEITGKEGSMLYFIYGNRTTQIKCKPEEILKHHWKPKAVPREEIVEVFKKEDEPDVGRIKQILLERHDVPVVERSMKRISNVVSDLTFDKYIREDALSLYDKHDELDINKNVGKVMRFMNEKVGKKHAGKIFNLLKRYRGKK